MGDAAIDVTPAQFLRLVADPHRWRLLQELARSDRRVGELTVLADAPQNLVSYHLAELRAAGLVSSRRSSADRRDTYYRVDVPRVASLLTAAGASLHPGVRLVPATAAPEPPRRRRRARVLFLCTGNSARSQMAEALLTRAAAGAVDARSAGTHPKPLHPLAVEVMAARGIDLSARVPTHVRRFARTRFDHVITLCDKAREVCPELPGAPATAHWSLPDPAGEPDGVAAFERVADEIDGRVGLLVVQLWST